MYKIGRKYFYSFSFYDVVCESVSVCNKYFMSTALMVENECQFLYGVNDKTVFVPVFQYSLVRDNPFLTLRAHAMYFFSLLLFTYTDGVVSLKQAN